MACENALEEHCKTPDEVLEYGWTWSDWLSSETIATSTWTASSGITIDSDSNTTTGTVVWLSGGNLGRTYTVVNKIVTSSSPARTAERAFLLTITATR
jgi:hypothetical protein